MPRFTPFVRMLVAAVAAVGGTACTDPGEGGAGMTRIALTDAPFPYEAVASAEVFVASVAVSRTADTGAAAGDQEWITVAEPNQAFDLLTLQNGETALLGETALPAAEYPAVRVVIDVDRSRLTWKDGSSAPVTWGGSGEMSLHALVERPIALPSGGGDIVIDFDVGRSFQTAGPAGPFTFVPWIRAVDAAAAGDVIGTVRVPADASADVSLENLAVHLLKVNPFSQEIAYITATARTDADGRFALHFVSEGNYLLNVAAPPGFAPVTTDVAVKPGDTFELDVVLEPDDMAGATVLRVSGKPEMVVGEAATFFAALFDANGDSITTDDVTWTSSDASVARVTLPVSHGGSQAALVEARAVGTALIAAASGSLSDTLRVTVREGDAGGPVAVIQLEPPSQTIAVGDTAGITATLRDAAGQVLSGREIGWTTSDSTIARIEATAPGAIVLRGTAAGTATITALSEGRSASASVTVTAQEE